MRVLLSKMRVSLLIAVSSIYSSPLVLQIEIYSASRGFLATAGLLFFEKLQLILIVDHIKERRMTI